MQTSWHLITSEYPPQRGGVGDYTRSVAAGLARLGHEVHVWCPASSNPPVETDGVKVHPELGAFRPSDLRRVGEQLDRYPAPRRILVQWVPHGYGYLSMNVPFCWWLLQRARREGDHVSLMAHEVFLAFRLGSLRQSAAALVHRFMSILLLLAAESVWVSIPAWERRWRPYTLGRKIPFACLPVPSNVPVAARPERVCAIRQQYAPNGLLLGHFGTFGPPITLLLEDILTRMGARPLERKVLFIGDGSLEFRRDLLERRPDLAELVAATGALPAEELSCYLAACDILLQPYTDGVSGRRGSAMAGLSHGKPIVSTFGELSEPFWRNTDALALAPAGDANSFVELLHRLELDPLERDRMGRAARRLYQERFDISIVVASLHQASAVPEKLACAS